MIITIYVRCRQKWCKSIVPIAVSVSEEPSEARENKLAKKQRTRIDCGLCIREGYALAGEFERVREENEARFDAMLDGFERRTRT